MLRRILKWAGIVLGGLVGLLVVACVGATYTTEDWVRAIRHGVGADRRALFFMLSAAFRQFSAEDTGALIAYLKALPPVDNRLPGRRFEPMARIMMGAGLFPPLAADQIDHRAAPPQSPAPGATAAYGMLLSSLCTECHGADLKGAPFGPPGEQVMTPNLTPAGELGRWSEADFITTMRTGLTPSTRQLNDEMPWKYFGQMTDDELKALWLYLRSLPASAMAG
jgi:mono/diheme cytochrome c family protein